MKEESRSGARSRSFDDRDEYGDQFVALGSQGLELRCGHDFSIDEQLQSVG